MPRKSRQPRADRRGGGDTTVRIIGGRYRGSRLAYHGDPRTRPMKDRVREALFNLVGPRVKGTHAFDLFAGTGAVGLEALSRGAASATLIERHFPTAALIDQNVAHLKLQDQARVVRGDTFHWARTRPEAPEPWVVFFSPPYELYESRAEDMLQLIRRFADWSPPGSLLAVEADRRLDCRVLPEPDAWDVRWYSPAQIAVRELEAAERAAENPEDDSGEN